MRMGGPLAAEKLTRWLLDRALLGLPPLVSAAELTRQYRANTALPHDEARLQALIRWETRKNFTAGFLSGLAGTLALPVTVPSGLGVAWLLQARLAAAVADLRGHSLETPWVQSLVLLSLTGAAAPDLLRGAGVRVGEWATRALVARVSEEALQQINRRVGFSLLRGAGSGGVVAIGRAVPLVGALVGGSFDAYGCRKVARAAQRLFEPQRLLVGPTA